MNGKEMHDIFDNFNRILWVDEKMSELWSSWINAYVKAAMQTKETLSHQPVDQCLKMETRQDAEHLYYIAVIHLY